MIHPAYRMGGCSGRILTFAYAETFHLLVALKPLHFGWAHGGCAARNPLPEGISPSWSRSRGGGSPPGCVTGQKRKEKLLAARLNEGFRASAPAPSKAGMELLARDPSGIWYLQGRKILSQSYRSGKTKAWQREVLWTGGLSHAHCFWEGKGVGQQGNCLSLP